MSSQKKQIFISYRRDGGETLARLLYDRLTADGYSVFYDIESLQSGKFNIALYERIMECTDFLLILSPSCLDRCVSPKDWLRQEIEFAKNCDKNIIPLMMRDFTFSTDLPDSLADIPSYHGIEVRFEHFDAVLSRLEKTLLHSRPDTECNKEIMEQHNVRKSEDRLNMIHHQPHPYSDSKTTTVLPGITKQESIRCPHCSCAYYKKHQFMTDAFFAPGKNNKSGLRFLNFVNTVLNFADGAGSLLLLFPLFMIAVMSAVFLQECKWSSSPSALAGISVSILLFMWTVQANRAYNVLKRMKTALVVSGQRIQSLKCVGCEQTFSVVIPNEGQLEDWLPGLIETDTK